MITAVLHALPSLNLSFCTGTAWLLTPLQAVHQTRSSRPRSSHAVTATPGWRKHVVACARSSFRPRTVPNRQCGQRGPRLKIVQCNRLLQFPGATSPRLGRELNTFPYGGTFWKTTLLAAALDTGNRPRMHHHIGSSEAGHLAICIKNARLVVIFEPIDTPRSRSSHHKFTR